MSRERLCAHVVHMRVGRCPSDGTQGPRFASAALGARVGSPVSGAVVFHSLINFD